MDSLLSAYASSDDEEEGHQQNQNLGSPSKSTSEFSKPFSSSIFSSLPQPKSSSLFMSLPPPKSHLSNTQTPQNPSLPGTHKAADGDDDDDDDDDGGGGDEDSISAPSYVGDSSVKFSGTGKITSLFSSLPKPKSHLSSAQTQQIPSPSHTHNVDPKSHLSNQQTITNLSSSQPNPKRVVQFRPPMNPYLIKSYKDGGDDDESDEDDKEKQRKRLKELESSSQTPSVHSFLSSIPAPKNSASAALGALPSSGSGRRSIVEVDIPASTVENEVGIDPNVADYESNCIDGSSSASLGTVDGQLGSVMSGGDPSNWVQSGENYGDYGSYGGYGDYGSYGHTYESNWVDGSTTMLPGKKRGRNEVPTEIVEVKQDELMKNRPREDQAKLTGIAFGPSYQPVSTKGKPSKLHKRKHQISSLYFDMKQKEMELSERRAKGFLTKAETQAKYGW